MDKLSLDSTFATLRAGLQTYSFVEHHPPVLAHRLPPHVRLRALRYVYRLQAYHIYVTDALLDISPNRDLF